MDKVANTTKTIFFICLFFIFNGSDGITHILLIFKGVRELKVRQIGYNIIFGW
jgi:hypothetical protein